jgi:hypothetical protein
MLKGAHRIKLIYHLHLNNYTTVISGIEYLPNPQYSELNAQQKTLFCCILLSHQTVVPVRMPMAKVVGHFVSIEEQFNLY